MVCSPVSLPSKPFSIPFSISSWTQSGKAFPHHSNQGGLNHTPPIPAMQASLVVMRTLWYTPGTLSCSSCESILQNGFAIFSSSGSKVVVKHLIVSIADHHESQASSGSSPLRTGVTLSVGVNRPRSCSSSGLFSSVPNPGIKGFTNATHVHIPKML